MHCRQQHISQLTSLEQQLQAQEAELRSLQTQAGAAHKAANLRHAQELGDIKACHEQTEQQLRQQLEAHAAKLSKQHQQEVSNLQTAGRQIMHRQLMQLLQKIV